MKKCIVLVMVCLLFALPVYAEGDTIDIKMYTVRYPTEAIAGHENTIFNSVEFKDFVSYYPFLYPEIKSEPHTFDIALLDNGALYEVKTVTFYETTPLDPESLRKDVDFVWIPLSDGYHDLAIVFDYSNQVPELREDNNLFSFSIFVFPSRKDRYLKFGNDNILLLLLAGLYLLLIIYYLNRKRGLSIDFRKNNRLG